MLCAKSQPATDQGTQVPQAVVYGSDPGTVLRMRDLGNKHRAGELSQGVAQTHKETGALVLWSAHGGGLDSSNELSTPGCKLAAQQDASQPLTPTHLKIIFLFAHPVITHS